MKSPPLSDKQVYELLHDMQVMCATRCETDFGENTLKTVSAALFTLQIALLTGTDDPSLKEKG